ncbi:predicted protein [Naegleria gruberi]|uniref:Predicted protein n=1 Tax=Naegleria gruberi TaxID=5762 RepID=D2V5F9_NAEGR|nr:uncharacterized protein NAEGRDRAFT_63808 [Naegleria gruberi]EFC48108.1 predicted protein [Naegleria gruberi]|eukprot:XP_002680852.1 predicted protein [Naegleria gruberi strain NEG-M]
MFQGHYGPAGVLHYFFRDISLAWLMVATQVIDVMFYSFSWTCHLACEMKIESNARCENVFCLEYGRYNVKAMRENKIFPFEPHNDISYSLTGSVIWTLCMSLLYCAINRPKNRSFLSIYGVFFMAIASHWLLDVIVRRNDVAILPPFTSQKIGFATWENWSRFENCLLEIAFHWIGAIFIIATKYGNERIFKSFWIALSLYIGMGIFMTRAIFYGQDTSKMADLVEDGEVFAPGHALFATITYFISAILGYFMSFNNSSQWKMNKTQ